MHDEHDRDHLDHLPGRGFLAAVAVVPALAVVGAVLQLTTPDHTSASTLWVVVVALGITSLLALGVAWEERNAHIHALVREAIEGVGHGGADPIAELMRMGAHRQVDYLRSRLGPATRQDGR